ncbi:uncharacterized protein LOC112561828 isoform X2 [Pomacea canaliculata]|nr:uncharacterized protein LOC112561828 isoform X2 [Pomacea canaliculata]
MLSVVRKADCHKSKMLLLAQVVFLLLFLEIGLTLKADCGREGNAIEDTNHAIWVFDFPPNSTVTVRFVITNHVTDIGFCDATGSCFPARNIFQLSRPNATSQMVVVKVERDGTNIVGTWRFTVGSDSAECRVNAVVYPPDVQFVSVVFDEYKKFINGTLLVSKVYPETAFKCEFYEKIQDRKYVEISSAYVSVTQNVYTSNMRDYYSFRCVLSKLLPEEEGSYKYKVSVSPLTREIEVNGTFQIRKPAKPTLQNCISTFIDFQDAQKKDADLCTCVVSDPGAPPGDVKFLSPDGKVLPIPQTSKNSSTLKASFVPWNTTEQDYTCIVHHHTGDVTETYQPKIAFGPRFVAFPDYASHKETTPFVYNRDQEYQLHLQVKGVNPIPIITCDGKPSATVETKLEPSGMFNFQKIFTIIPKPEDNGRVINCTVVNPSASSVPKEVVSTKLYIQFAPQGPPEIDYNNKKAYYAGDKLIMTCTVNGGNPLVDRVNFGCGEREIPNKGSNSRHPTSVSQTLTLELTNEDHGLQCQCSATHLTDTYSLTKTIVLDVKDGTPQGSVQSCSTTRPSIILLILCLFPKIILVSDEINV